MKRNSILILSGLLILTVSCGGNASTEVKEDGKTKVTTEMATREKVEQISVFTGTVEAQVINKIAPQTSVRIGKIYVEVGDNVRKGQKLVEMDDANLIQAKVRFDNDKIEFERLDELYKIGGASKSDRDAKKLAYDISKTNYNNLAENTTLLSPINGTVTVRNYDNGDMYSASNPILVVEQISPVKLKINVSEVLFTNIKKGMTVDVITDVYENQKFVGIINLVYPSIDPNTRTFPVEVILENADHKIRPGMFARVSLTHGIKERVVVNDRAIIKQTGSGDKYVYVVNDGKVEFKKVELGRRMDDKFEIISGLDDGDQAIITGHSRITNGMEVEVVKQ